MSDFKEKNKKAIEAFLKRKIYSSEDEVLFNALKLLIKDQKEKEVKLRSQEYYEETYSKQIKENYKEIEGSILDAKEDIIVQGCNCAGASGSGIAKYIAKEYPSSDQKYKKLCKDKKFSLGTVMFNLEKDKLLAFCGTQEYYGKFLKMDEYSIKKRYLAIEKSLIQIYDKAKEENLSVALPRIGCGRARGD